MSDADHQEPKYLQVVDAIIDQIRSGKLRPGDTLDSIATLATRHDTGATTIKTAHAVLRAQGWITGRQGKAVYVAPNPPEAGTTEPDT